MQQNITIFTGKKQSGKTTALLQYCNKNKNIVGILTPIINNKRCFYNIETTHFFEMEYCGKPNDIAICVGKYTFSTNAFEKANIIFQNLQITNNQLVIIDEVGPLELDNKGFTKSILHLLQNNNCSLLLVVREGLVNDVIEKFSLQNCKIITSVL